MTSPPPTARTDEPRQEFTDRELMVIAAAREIRDEDVVFVGMRLPLIAFAYAKRTHAPRAVGLFENGIVRDQPSPETLLTMSDTPNIPGARHVHWEQPRVGHYGIFNGRKWREQIMPRVRDFIRDNDAL